MTIILCLHPVGSCMKLRAVFWLALVAATVVVAQVGTFPCTVSSFSWADNSMGQDACQVAESLSSSSSCGQLFLAPIGTASSLSEYPGPLVSSANNCTCSSIFYSLLSACAACQNATWLSWPSFTQNCTQTYLMQFPNGIPVGLTLPQWVYLNVSATNNTFDVNAAHNNATASTSVTTSVSASASTTSIPRSSSSKTSDADVIAGAVVGGVVGGLLIIALLYWLYVKRKSSAQTSTIKRETSPSINSLTDAQPPQDPSGSNDVPSSPTSPRTRDGARKLSGLYTDITGRRWGGRVGQNSGWTGV